MAAVALALLGLSLPQALAQFSLNIVHWGDLHGRMVPSKDRGAVPCTDLTDQECYGGLARIAQVCKAQKSATPNALCLDAGDSFSGSYWTDVDTDSTYLKAMNTFVDAYVIGNHDFDKGIDHLASFIDDATFPVLGACNLDLSAEPRLQGKVEKWATFDLDGTKVAILGFSNVDQSAEMAAITGNIGFLESSDPKGMVACINEFRFKNPEQGWVIGILSHAGVSGDLRLIRNVNSVQLDVSFVVGGHSHEAFFENKRGRCLRTEYNATLMQTFCDEKTRETSRYEYPADAESGAGTIKLLHSGWAGKYVGQAQLQYNAIGLLNEAAGQMVPTGTFFDDALSPFNIAPDQEVEKMLAADAAALQTFKEQPIAILPVPLESLQPLIYTQEQVAGGVICSALMWSARNLGFGGTPQSPLVCLQNAQTIRRSLASGPISIKDVENMLPPEQGLSMTIVEIERVSLISALENSVSTLNTANMEVPDDRFVHIGGGLQFTYDVSRQPYRFNRTSGELLQPGNRVTGVTYDCGELPEGPVRVVLNSQLAEGVQDYFGLKQGDTLLTFGPLLSESLSQYLDAAAPQDGQIPGAVTDLPAQINAPPPCATSAAWKDVAAESYALQPLPATTAVAPGPAAAAAPPPAPTAPKGPAANGSAAATPPPAPPLSTPPPPSPPAAAGATPADTSSDTGAPAETGEIQEAENSSAVVRRVLVAIAAAAAAACVLFAP